MGLTWAQIRDNAIVFQDRWKNASGNERSEAQTFVYELLRDVYGVDPRRVATFEQKVHPTSDTNGYIDMLWPGRILIEMKSKGKSLDKAHDQARKYAFAIPNDARSLQLFGVVLSNTIFLSRSSVVMIPSILLDASVL